MLAEILRMRGKEKLDKVPSMSGLELASRVSTKKPYFFGNKDSKYKIAVLDLGVKKNIPLDCKHLSQYSHQLEQLL